MASVDKIIIEYGADIKEIKSELAELKKQLGGVDQQAKESAQKTETALNQVGANVSGKLTSAFKVLGTTIIAAFSIRAIGNFISSSIELAVRTQEVKAAFDKLNTPTLLNNLKKATEGTVSDLKLMGLALKANQLQIPLQNLGKILQFAKLRADELGRSTEELAETIIQGIGTKSTRALVQVGISQEQFGVEVKKTGDYFTALDSVMTKTLENAGEGFDSVADKQDRLRANIENTKVEIGEKLLPVIDSVLTFFNDKITEIDRSWTAFKVKLDAPSADPNKLFGMDVQDKINQFIDLNMSLETASAELDKMIAKVESGEVKSSGAFSVRLKALQEYVKSLKSLEKQSEEVNKKQVVNTNATKENIIAISKETDEFEESIRIMTLSTEARDVLTDALQKMAMAIGNSGIEVRSETRSVDRMRDAHRSAEEGVVSLTGVFADNRTELEKQIDAVDMWGNAFLDVISSINYAYSAGSDYRLSLLQNELDQGIISQERFDRENLAIKRKEAAREKAYSGFSIVLSTARAIMSALATVPPNVALATLSAVTGAIQLATVVATPLPAFKTGKIGIDGEGTETSDSIVARLSKGESVITARATKKHKALLEAVNRDQVEKYISNIYLKDKNTHNISDADYRTLLAIKEGTYNQNRNHRELIGTLKNNQRRHRAIV